MRTPLLTRNPRGIELTPAGRAFLEHARLALARVDAGCQAARRAAQPVKPTLALGFLTGQEMDWLPAAMRVIREEPNHPDLVFTLAAREPLVVVLPSDHRLASRSAVRIEDLASEVFINVSNTAPVLRAVIDCYPCPKLPAVVGDEPAACGRHADDRSDGRPQPGEYIAAGQPISRGLASWCDRWALTAGHSRSRML